MIAYPIIGYAAGVIAIGLFVLALCRAADDERWEREELEVVEREERDEVERSVGNSPEAACQLRGHRRGAATGIPADTGISRKAPVPPGDAGLITRASAGVPLSLGPPTRSTSWPGAEHPERVIWEATSEPRRRIATTREEIAALYEASPGGVR